MAVYKCAGRKRFDDDGDQLCTYEATKKWTGKCPGCGRYWDVEKIGSDKKVAERATLASLEDAPERPRIMTNIPQVDRVLNGGIPEGASLLISGPPGQGKTSLLLAIADKVASERKRVTYASGEQSTMDIAGFAKRLGVKNPFVTVLGNEGDIFKIAAEVEASKSRLLIIDSIQKAFCDNVRAEPGSSAQCVAVANFLVDWGKSTGVASFIVSHVNKDLELAGPKAAEHLVDGTLEFDPGMELDKDGEPTEETKHWRKLTSGSKFRIGPSFVSELFEMTSEGIKPVVRKGKILRIK